MQTANGEVNMPDQFQSLFDKLRRSTATSLRLNDPPSDFAIGPSTPNTPQ